jgi:hypothetical protein
MTKENYFQGLHVTLMHLSSFAYNIGIENVVIVEVLTRDMLAIEFASYRGWNKL